MPNFERSDAKPADDLEITSKVLDTVQRQIGSYRMSLEKLRLLRQELQQDNALATRIWSSPDMMAKIFIERGIPEALAFGMAAEDFQDENFARGLGFWTWDCCCTNCCITGCSITSCGVTNVNPHPVRGKK
jgi:hypothetical protein